ncbi:hypothetical protein, partial [Acetomicrobium sp. S15 = DSM 107314]|uniref:hypothetical protein n=1 Tax=Acetomicrobium sp. S15 = DSM 107314 TaxID=2529858 RepID=UPI0018E13655
MIKSYTEDQVNDEIKRRRFQRELENVHLLERFDIGGAGHCPVADPEEVSKALKLLLAAEAPLIICGQGVLYSQAWDEVSRLAE